MESQNSPRSGSHLAKLNQLGQQYSSQRLIIHHGPSPAPVSPYGRNLSNAKPLRQGPLQHGERHPEAGGQLTQSDSATAINVIDYSVKELQELTLTPPQIVGHQVQTHQRVQPQKDHFYENRFHKDENTPTSPRSPRLLSKDKQQADPSSTQALNPNADIGVFLPSGRHTQQRRSSFTHEQLLAVQTASSKQAVDPVTRTRISNNVKLPQSIRKHVNQPTLTLESQTDSLAPFDQSRFSDDNKSNLASIYGDRRGESRASVPEESAQNDLKRSTVLTNNQIYRKQVTTTTEGTVNTRANKNKVMEDVIKSKDLRKAAIGLDDAKPRPVFGLPSLDVCQGREPPAFMSGEFLHAQTARVRNQLNAYKSAQKEPEVPQYEMRYRRKSSRRKRKPPSLEKAMARQQAEEMAKPKQLSAIQSIIGKYIYDYPVKGSKRNRHLSQSIDMSHQGQNDTFSRFPQLTTTPTAKDGYLSARPRITQVSQSIDVSKYFPGGDFLAVDDEAFAEGINRQVADFKQEQSDLKIVMTDEFRDPVEKIQRRYSPVDFKEHLDELTDLKNSPFPDANTQQKKKVSLERVSPSTTEEMKKQYLQNQALIAAAQVEGADVEDYQKTMTLLQQSPSYLQEDSLERTIGTASHTAKQLAAAEKIKVETHNAREEAALSGFGITLDDLDVGLSQFQKTTNTLAKLEMLNAPPIEEAAEIDARLLDGSKALDLGNLTQYRKCVNTRDSEDLSEMMKLANERVKHQNEQDMVSDDEINRVAGMNSGRLTKEDRFDDDMPEIKEPTNEEDVDDKDKLLLGALGSVKQARDKVTHATIDDLNKLLDGFILDHSVGKDFSPLLTAYNQLAEQTRLTLPVKSILEQDQKFFVEAIKKLRRAQTVEIAWIKKSALEAGRQVLDMKVHKVQQDCTIEVRNILRQYNTLRKQSVDLKNENSRIVDTLTGYEKRIAELTNYVKTLQTTLAEEEIILQELDVEAIEHDESYKPPCQKCSKKKRRRHSPMSKIAQDVQGIKSPLQMGYPPLVQPTGAASSQKCTCELRNFAILQNKFLNKVTEDINFEKSNADAVMESIEPLFKEPYSLYSSHLSLNQEDRVSLVHRDLIQGYKAKIYEQDDYIEVLRSESAYFMNANAKLVLKNYELEREIEELKKQIENNMKFGNARLRDAIREERMKFNEMKKKCDEELATCKKIFTCEVLVQEKLLERALKDNREKTDHLRKFAFILKVPRMHHEYIERNGVDPFITKFTKLIAENQALKNEMDRIGEQRRVRKAVSLIKHGAKTQRQSHFTRSLPRQVELVISQRSKFLGKALDEVKVNLKGQTEGFAKDVKREFVDERISSLSTLNQAEQTESSVFNKSILVGGSHTFSQGMLQLKGVHQQDGQIEEEKSMMNIKKISPRKAATTRSPKVNASVTNLRASQPSTAVDIHAINSVSHTNSKTILHQAYLQALKQSSSVQSLNRNDNMPHNILARSDAELATTREDFLDQYDMFNQYKLTVPSYKYTLSTSLIDSVETVLKNKTQSKDYVRENLETSRNLIHQNSMTASKTLTGTHISKNASAERIIVTQNSSKKLLGSSYDDGKPYYQQVGMKNWESPKSTKAFEEDKVGVLNTSASLAGIQRVRFLGKVIETPSAVSLKADTPCTYPLLSAKQSHEDLKKAVNFTLPGLNSTANSRYDDNEEV